MPRGQSVSESLVYFHINRVQRLWPVQPCVGDLAVLVVADFRHGVLLCMAEVNAWPEYDTMIAQSRYRGSCQSVGRSCHLSVKIHDLMDKRSAEP
jgi:hypothetical protein